MIPTLPRTRITSPLLVVEDVDEDYNVLMRILGQHAFAHPVIRCTDGDDALDFLYRRGPYRQIAARPGLILLDLNLPGTDGREVLEQLKGDPQLRQTPVVVLTTSSNPRDVEFCYRAGANSYITKPVDLQQLSHAIKSVLHYWFELVLLPG